MAKWDIIILLRFSLSSSTHISLFVDSILFLLSLSLFFLFPLLPAQESCSRSLSRKLPPISPPHFPVLAVDLAASCSSFGWFGGFWVLIWVEVVGGELGDFDGLGWSCGLWLRWVDSGDLGWGCGLRSNHGSRLRLGFDLGWGSGLSFDGLISVRGESQWLCCVCVCGWWLPVEKWRKMKVVGAWIVFFFSSSYCHSLWLWMVGQRWKWLLLLCCDGLVFFFPFLLRFLDLEFFVVVVVVVVVVDVIAVVDRHWCCCCCWWWQWGGDNILF